ELRDPLRSAPLPEQAPRESGGGERLRLRHRRRAGAEDVLAPHRLQLGSEPRHAQPRAAARRHGIVRRSHPVRLPAGPARLHGRLVYSRVDPTINDALLITNTDKGNMETVAFKVERPYRNGFYASASYLYGRSQTVSDGGAFVAKSSWSDQYVTFDANNPAL